MRILFAGNKSRGAACLRALRDAGHEIAAVVAHPGAGGPVADAARELGLELLDPTDVNDPSVLARFRELEPDLIVLAGYSQIVREELIAIPPHGCLNLHAGKLPEYRGSSPLNWALINGESEFTLNVIQVDTGVDTGDVLVERSFPIAPEDTIAELQAQSDEAFPEMLVEAVGQVADGSATPRVQGEDGAGYWPLRRPDDGLILFDMHTAEQVHNRVRALAPPAPPAYSFHAGRRVELLGSRLTESPFYGEPGRVYRVTEQGLLVCASDRSLWITRAAIGSEDAREVVQRYDKLATVRDAAAVALSRE